MIRIEYSAISRSIVAELESKLNASQLRQALRSASKSATTGIKQYAMSQAVKQFTSTSRNLKSHSKIEIQSDDTEAILNAEGKRLPLIYFKHNPKKIFAGPTKERLNVAVERGHNESRYPAFIQHANNSTQIFKRIGQGRTIGMQRGSSLPEMLTKKTISETIMKRMVEQYEAEIERILEK